MSWFNTGYDAAKEEGSKSLFESSGPKRVWMPPRETMRGMFLDDDPISYWEHGFKMNGKWGNFEPCHKKNRQLGDDRCPICDSGEKMWPSFVGLHTIMNMTPWFTKKENREINFQRQIYGAKMGSEKKPGILKKLERLKSTHGRLRGIIFDIHRSGEKTESCGDDFTLVEKIDVGDIQKYAREQVGLYVKRINEKLPAKDHVTVDQLFKKNPWEPFNFEKVIQPRKLSELDRLFGAGGKASGGSDDDFGGGEGEGKSKGDDDKGDDKDESSPY